MMEGTRDIRPEGLGGIALALLLAGCAPKVMTVEKPVIQHVEVRVACPPKEESDRLLATRPKPLRDQPVPPTAVERNAKTQAQLGQYEADGAWGDQVVTALHRCAQP